MRRPGAFCSWLMLFATLMRLTTSIWRGRQSYTSDISYLRMSGLQIVSQLEGNGAAWEWSFPEQAHPHVWQVKVQGACQVNFVMRKKYSDTLLTNELNCEPAPSSVSAWSDMMAGQSRSPSQDRQRRRGWDRWRNLKNHNNSETDEEIQKKRQNKRNPKR